MTFQDVVDIVATLKNDGTPRKAILIYVAKHGGTGYVPLNISHMAAHLQMNRHTVDKWVREMVTEGLLARNIFTEFGELRAIIRLPWRRIHSLLEEQL